MKKQALFLTFLSLICITTITAQVYRFEVDSQAYEEVPLYLPSVLTPLYYRTPIGFEFSFNGHITDTLYFPYFLPQLENMGDTMMRPAGYWDTIPLERKLTLAFHPYKDHINGYTSGADLYYRTEGPPGNQIFKLQYKNIYNMADTNWPFVDYANVQLWLYEGTNNIEYRYGPSSWTQGGFPRPISLREFYPFSTSELDIISPAFDVHTFYGNPNNPTHLNYDDASLTPVTTWPSSGIIYRFIATPTGISETTQINNRNLFPNPAFKGQAIFLKSIEMLNRVNIQSIDGKILFEQNNIQSNTLEIPSQNWAKGVYIVQQTNAQGQSFSEKLIID